MKSTIYKGILLLLSIGLMLSCSKDEDDDNNKTGSCLTFNANEVLDDPINIKTFISFNSDKEIIDSEVIIEYENEEHPTEKYEITVTYEGENLTKLSSTANNESIGENIYEYTDGKVTKIEVYKSYGETGKKNIFEKKLKIKKHYIGKFSNELYLERYVDISYIKDKPDIITDHFLTETGDYEESILTLTWSGNNISDINRVGFMEETTEHLQFEYDDKNNPIKGITLGSTLNPYFSAVYQILIDQLGILPYYNENNIKKISAEGSNGYSLILKYELSYNEGLITGIVGSIEEFTPMPEIVSAYSFDSNIGYECN
ncbi:MAG: hypothetical protein ABFS12_17955 [Bacteroidota bacterium]